MNLTYFYHRLKHLTLARLVSILFHPWLVRIILEHPPVYLDMDFIVKLFPHFTKASIEKHYVDFLKNDFFFAQINNKMIAIRLQRAQLATWHLLLYLIARLSEPRIIVETGVFDGLSSAVILQALHDNNKGTLLSIDLPRYKKNSTGGSLPPNGEPGWSIPEYLRKRHSLILGDSATLLPQLLEKYKEIDIFFHDSLHTYRHQLLEYATAWQFLSKGGFLLSHDILSSLAFYKFIQRKRREVSYILDENFGIIQKLK